MSISLFSIKKGKPTNLIEGNIGVWRLRLFLPSVTHPMAMEVEFVLGAVEEKDSDLGHERVHRRREQMMLERECENVLGVEPGMEIHK